MKSMVWFVAIAVTLIVGGCSTKSEDAHESAKAATVSEVGVGPIQRVELGALDVALAKKGAVIFEQKCSACHKLDSRYVGPALQGVTQRRKPEWIMNMILNPAEMLEKDPTAKELLATYLTPMTFQNVSHDQARALLEYFRQVDGAVH
ncbi:MAG: hypothetical protein KatS3mg039_0538 [Candidatus Kapaibacterium sp.]|nr:MAG: hypothetical protein KatS3mg039_0538 [Candidatus Kapabacteria bacterium]